MFFLSNTFGGLFPVFFADEPQVKTVETQEECKRPAFLQAEHELNKFNEETWERYDRMDSGSDEVYLTNRNIQKKELGLEEKLNKAKAEMDACLKRKQYLVSCEGCKSYTS